MNDRPVCSECEHLRLVRHKDPSGWDAVCTAKSRHGRLIEMQYGLNMKFAKKELLDKIEIRICPGWCMKWRKP